MLLKSRKEERQKHQMLHPKEGTGTVMKTEETEDEPGRRNSPLCGSRLTKKLRRNTISTIQTTTWWVDPDTKTQSAPHRGRNKVIIIKEIEEKYNFRFIKD